MPGTAAKVTVTEKQLVILQELSRSRSAAKGIVRGLPDLPRCPAESGGRRHSHGERGRGDGIAIGGVVVDAKQELSRRIFASAAFATRRAEGDHRDGAQARTHLVQPDAIRRRIHAKDRSRVRRSRAHAAGEKLPPSRKRVGLRGPPPTRDGRRTDASVSGE